jgi:hypothetical protein
VIIQITRFYLPCLFPVNLAIGEIIHCNRGVSQCLAVVYKAILFAKLAISTMYEESGRPTERLKAGPTCAAFLATFAQTRCDRRAIAFDDN